MVLRIIAADEMREIFAHAAWLACYTTDNEYLDAAAEVMPMLQKIMTPAKLAAFRLALKKHVNKDIDMAILTLMAEVLSQ